MRLARALVSATALALTLVVAESSAHALGPIDVEAGAKVGVATNPFANGVNPYGFGLGVRGGVGIFGFYGGVSAVHYFGSSTDIPSLAGTINATTSSTLLGLELGYTISALPLVNIRPQLGIGNITYYTSASGNDSSNAYLYLEPGVALLVPLGLLYVGADANPLVVPSVDALGSTDKKAYTSFTVHGQIGVRF